MTKPVVHVEDGEWVTIAWKKQREMCCGCGLEHDVDYRVEDGKLQFRAVQRGRKRTKSQ
jgi:hypothetical protein